MANRIQNDYRSHMQANSPDLDRLWNRIEQRIDAQQKPEQPIITQTSQPQITVKKNSFIKYAAAAACLIAVIAGTVIFVNSRDNKVKMSETSSKGDTSIHYAVKSDESESAAAEKTNEDDKPATADIGENNNNREFIKENNDDSEIEGDKPTRSADEKKYDARNNTKQSELGVSPIVEINKLMHTDEYKNADRQQKLSLAEALAKSLKEKESVTAYEIITQDNTDIISITLPDGAVRQITLK